MKRILLLLLLVGCFALPSLSQTVKPVTEEDMRCEKEIQEAMRNYEKYMPKSRTVEDKIETLFYKAVLYNDPFWFSDGPYLKTKAKESFCKMADLCRKEYGECSLQYIVALSLIDWIDKDMYDYIPRDERIGRLISALYPQKDKQLYFLKKLSLLHNLFDIQMFTDAYDRKNSWFLENSEEERFPFSYSFYRICKTLDPTCYPSTVKCARSLNSISISDLNNSLFRGGTHMDAYDVRYCALVGSAKTLFTSNDILEICRCQINNFITFPVSDNALEAVRPLLEVEVSSRAYYDRSVENICAGYDAVLLKKGLSLQADLRSEWLSDKDMDAFRKLHYEYQDDRDYYHALRLHATSQDSIEMYNRILRDLSGKYNNVCQNSIFDKTWHTDFSAITWEYIRLMLGQKDVAIEFVRLPEDVGATYYALILRSYYLYPHLIPLCKESELSAYTGMNAFADDSVYNAIWKPLAKEIEGTKNIYFSADGLLHDIPIEYVANKDKVPFADAIEGRNIYRLSSTREVYLNHKKPKLETAAIYGGIKYSTDTLSMKTDAERYIQHLTTSKPNDLITSNDRSVDVLRDMSFGYLGNTLSEAQNIAEKCQQNGVKASLYTNEDGSESSFKALSGKDSKIIHIATHGFYIDEPMARDGLTPLSDKYRSNLDRNGNIIDDPMLRSGLLFSGADNILNNVAVPEGVDDGILYSKEVGELDFHNTDLVVLSACQTAQGEISSEGVFGLQRGFKQAGVGSVLMSLWKVNDEATEMLMEEFYHQLLECHHSKYDALQMARNKLRQSDEFNSPRYWAAFIILDAE